MSDENEGVSEEMDSELKEYLSYFKNNGAARITKTTSPAKPRIRHTHEKARKNPSLNSSEDDSLLEDSSLFSTAPPHKKFNLQDVNDLQASDTMKMSENDVTSSSTKRDDDNDTVSAIGKLVLSLKELGPPSGSPEGAALSNTDIDEVTTNSFNVNANIFTMDDLVADDDTKSINSNSIIISDKKIVTEDVGCKTTGVDDSEVTNNYEDDFEEEDKESENTESFVNGSIKELVSSKTTENIVFKSDESADATISLSCDSDKDSSISWTEDKQSFEHSSTPQDTNISIESSLSKHEVCAMLMLTLLFLFRLLFKLIHHGRY